MDRKRLPALSHARVWETIDALAARHGLSASGLARKAGLNATTFNRSKRVGGDGRPRWPSMESIAKVLDATGASLAEFCALLSGDDAAAWTGHAAGGDRGLVPTPDAALFALEMTSDAFAPLYRVGAIVVLAPTAEVYPGDQVVMRDRDGAPTARVLRRATATTLEFDAPDGTLAVSRDAIVWLGRVVWVSP